MGVRQLLRKQHYIANERLLDEMIRRCIRAFLEAGLAHDQPLRAVEHAMAYALLYNRDLSCILEDLDDPPSTAHRNLYSRLVVLLADECFVKMPILTGRDLRIAFETWEATAEHRSALSECGKQFRLLKKADAKWIGDLRDNVIGHRDLAVAKQWRLMQELDVERIHQLSLGLLAWTNSLYGLLSDVLKHRTVCVKASRKDA